MEYIQIPIPDFSFEDIAKERAELIIERHLHDAAISLYISGGNPTLENSIQAEISLLFSLNEKLICIIELIGYLTGYLKEITNQVGINEVDIKRQTQCINRIKYLLYSLASTSGYNFDQNAFSDKDVNQLNRKINAILIKLDEIQVGNEVLFNEIEEFKNNLKEDFESLKSDYPLGKKRWYQRAAGIVVSYTGTKGADEVYEQLKPLMHDFLLNHVPRLIDKL